MPGFVATVEKLEKVPQLVPSNVASARWTRICEMPDSGSVPQAQSTETASRLEIPSR